VLGLFVQNGLLTPLQFVCFFKNHQFILPKNGEYCYHNIAPCATSPSTATRWPTSAARQPAITAATTRPTATKDPFSKLDFLECGIFVRRLTQKKEFSGRILLNGAI
jgi:hypothetical protein